jgi:hypothetical protein
MGFFVAGALETAGVVEVAESLRGFGELVLVTFASAMAAIILGAFVRAQTRADDVGRRLALVGVILGGTVFATVGLAVLFAFLAVTGVFGGSG